MTGGGKRQTLMELKKSLQMKSGKEKALGKKPKPLLQEKLINLVIPKKKMDRVKKDRRNDSIKNLIKKAKLQKIKTTKKQSSLKCQVENISNGTGTQPKENARSQNIKKSRKRKRRKNNVEHDEPTRLQRRTRYLLVKMKLEQNLIDAYAGEGWKGQSREKIRPEKELQRAKQQILKCKLAIRDSVRQLESLGSVGCIEESAVAPDGSVYHEHIICAICKLREAFPDNDIILCDGSCNSAFHQKCLDPPLLTENIPMGDQGWLCKYCECKTDILEAINAHLGTHFSPESNWQDIFKEEAALPDGGGSILDPEQDFPSDDSEDDDFDPENSENCSCSYSRAGSEDDSSGATSSSSSLCFPEGELFSGLEALEERTWKTNFGTDSNETSDCEILGGRRQRKEVNYQKLYDEMFGKDTFANEQISEDEDWGPTKRKRRAKESDAASTLMAMCENEKKHSEKSTPKVKDHNNKRPFFRLPPDAVEKLRLAFVENELPSRLIRENLSNELGLEFEKVNKWFKNARYLALKSRKVETGKKLHTASPRGSMECKSDNGQDKSADLLPVQDMSSVQMVNLPKDIIRFQRRKNLPSFTSYPQGKTQLGSKISKKGQWKSKYIKTVLHSALYITEINIWQLMSTLC
ncbi:pathogenesis-related homeodomain protein isoform X2 [Apium graveolens]|uniref:pathogenesis-related homeodomain protein isoform X2 n=1 Tax=Apium graveolens TaxID=4045 RepID=UPI003D7B8F94